MYVVVMNVLAIELLALRRTAVLLGGILSKLASRGPPLTTPKKFVWSCSNCVLKRLQKYSTGTEFYSSKDTTTASALA